MYYSDFVKPAKASLPRYPKRLRPDHFDYGICMNTGKAYIVAIGEFEENCPTHVTTVLYPEQQPECGELFIQQIIGELHVPHRILIFGSSDDRYMLHKALQKDSAYDQVTKELCLAFQVDEPADAQLFTEQHFRAHPSF
jgi:hypothetical protein